MKFLEVFSAWYADVAASSTTLGFVDPDTTVIVPTAKNDTFEPDRIFDHAVKLPDSCNVVLYPLSAPFKSCTQK